MKKKKAAILFTLFSLLAGVLAACGSSKASYDTAVTQESAAYDGGYAASYVEEQGIAVTGDVQVTEEALEAESAKEDSSRKLIRSVNMEVETEDYDALLSALEEQISQTGGYIEYKNLYLGSSYSSSSRSANMTARIPSDRLDEFIGQVSEEGNVTYESESVEDVTLNYVDLESHKKMLQAEQERLMELMETAETVEDMITVEERLSEVRYQLESMESQLRTYDNQIDYSKVELYINEVERYTPVQEKSAWDRIRTGFTENVYRVTKGIKNFCIEFVIALPILIVWALVIFVVIMLLRWIRSRRKAGKHRMFGKKTEDTTSGKEENGEQQPKL